MARNLELKARCSSIEQATTIARNLCRKRSAVLQQTDTYFGIPKVRLKLRVIAGRKSEMILYDRADTPGPKLSRYKVVPVANPRQIQSLCKKLFGILVIVRKERHLYLFRNARIHLDRVSGLGTFIEFEVVVRRGMKQAHDLMERLKGEFGIRQKDLLSSSYSNLLIKNRQRRNP